MMLAFRRPRASRPFAVYVVHVFDTPELRAQGLSGLDEWPEDHAALFHFDETGRQLIHTQGMRFPIDIVATDVDGAVIGYAADAQPNEACFFEAPDGTAFVIELAAGEIARHDLWLHDIATTY